MDGPRDKNVTVFGGGRSILDANRQQLVTRHGV
jgi:hypothetical protein